MFALTLCGRSAYHLFYVLISEIEFNMNLIHEHIRMWDPYTHIWKVDKDEFMVKYREERHAAAEFDTLIISYSDLANTVQIQETVNQVHNYITNKKMKLSKLYTDTKSMVLFIYYLKISKCLFFSF